MATEFDLFAELLAEYASVIVVSIAVLVTLRIGTWVLGTLRSSVQ